jgi:F5/8 type C domain
MPHRFVSFFWAGAALAVIFAARPARADVPTNVNPANCRAAEFDQTSLFTTGSHSITAKTSNTGNFSVYCPITKKTSGPAVLSGDGIKSVKVTTTSAGLVDCMVMTRRAPISGDSDNNQISPTPEGRNSTALTFTITTPSNRPVRYWDANGTPPSGSDLSLTPAWYYSYLSCSLSPGATVSADFVVTEYGTATGYTIDPMLTCPLTSNMHWRFSDIQGAAGGYTQAQSFGGFQQFSYSCPMVNVVQNAVVEVAATTTYINPSGCNLNNSNFSTFTYSLMDPSYSSQWPTRVLDRPYRAVIGLPVQGSNTMYCGQNAASGDGRWASFRVSPNHSHIGAPDSWVASSSEGATSVNNAIDANTSTRWSSNKAGKAGMWYQVYAGYKVFNELTFDSGTDVDDYPRAFTVLGSYDGVSFDEIASGTGSTHMISVTFGEQPYPYYRIRLDQDIKSSAGATKYWSIRELNLYLNDGTN